MATYGLLSKRIYKMKALLLGIFLLYGCTTYAEPKQNLNLAAYNGQKNYSTYYYKLANQYRGRLY